MKITGAREANLNDVFKYISLFCPPPPSSSLPPPQKRVTSFIVTAARAGKVGRQSWHEIERSDKKFHFSVVVPPPPPPPPPPPRSSFIHISRWPSVEIKSKKTSARNKGTHIATPILTCAHIRILYIGSVCMYTRSRQNNSFSVSVLHPFKASQGRYRCVGAAAAAATDVIEYKARLKPI